MKGLIFNAIIGNQIVIRGNIQLKLFMGSLLKLIGCLLPKTCRRIVEYSEVYLDSWQCNLLGLLSSEITIPDYVDTSNYALVNISQSSHDLYTFDYLGKSTEKTTMGSDIERLMESHLPRNIEKLILRNIQEEWMRKVKLFYSLSLKLESKNDPKIKQFFKTLNLFKNDLEVLKFWSGSIKRTLLKKKSNAK